MKIILAAVSTAFVVGLFLTVPALAGHGTSAHETAAPPAPQSAEAASPLKPRRVISRVIGSAYMLNADGTVFTGD